MKAVVFKNARIIDPSRDLDETGSIIVQDGVIRDSGAGAANQGAPNGAEIIDCKGRLVIPGLVDSQVHIGEPGAEYRETIASASIAAAAGGVTSLVMMPETNPAIDDVALVEFVRRTARETAVVNVYPSAAITKGLEGNELTEIGLLRDAGAVAFSEGRKTIANALVMRRALTYAKDFNALVSHHTEDKTLASAGVMNEGLFASWLGLPGIPVEAELIALERDLRLVALTGGQYHAPDLSAAKSVEAVQSAKDRNLDVTSGVSVNHLSLNEIDIGEYRTFFRLSPPLRTEDDRLALVEGLRNGTIDIIASAHDPQDVDTKRLPFQDAEPGAIGLETLLAATLRLHHDGSVPLMRLIDAVTAAPARRFGIDAGTLKPGVRADLAIIDIDAPWIVRKEEIQSRSKNTCFEDARFQGRVLQTWVAGRKVFDLEAS